MSQYWFCRICLDDRAPLQDLVVSFSQQYLTILTGIQISEFDSLPRWICNRCSKYLFKFHQFREKTLSSHQFLLNNIDNLNHGHGHILELYRMQQEKSYPSALGQSNTLVLDLHSQKNDKFQENILSFLNENKHEKNYCKDMIPVADSKHYFSSVHLDPSVKNEIDQNESDPCIIKLEENESYNSQSDNVKQNNSSDLKTRKRKAKALSEMKRSNNYDAFYSDYDDRDYSSIEEEESKIIKKKSKKGKRKSAEFTSQISNSKNSKKLKQSNNSTSNSNNDSIINSRMVLETEQYKVIKLNRDQLLEEMNANSKSERYLNSPHKCTLCVKGFNYEDVLQNHMMKHEPKNGPFECDLCHQFLPSAISMRGHKKSHNTKYQCKKCGVVKASRQHLLEHYMLEHEGAPRTYICNVCGKTLTKRTMFQKHMRIHYPTNKIACEKCGKLFKTIETLRAHMLHHEDGSLTRHTDIKRFSCDQCPKAFKYASLLYTHKVTHITTKDYYCVECDMHFKTESNLKLHLRKSLKHVDPDILRYACEKCDKRYEDEKGLRHHVEWVHLGQKNYKCSKCDMQYGSADGLRSHMKKIHDGIRPPRTHTCNVCGKAFRARAVLVKHQRIHTGERPYECNECGKKFAQNSTMSTHIKLVHLKIQRHVNRKKSTPSNQDELHAKVEAPAQLLPPNELHSKKVELPIQNISQAEAYYYPTSSNIEQLRPICIPVLPISVQFQETSRM